MVRNMAKPNKLASLLIVCSILTILYISGCLDLFYEFVPPPEGPKRLPRNPTVAVDSMGNAHIVWGNGTLMPEYATEPEYISHLSYLKLDKHGNKLTGVKWLDGYNARLITDSENMVHIITDGLSYTKLNNIGDVLIPTKNIPTNNTKGSSDRVGLLDSNDNIHIVHREIVGSGNAIWHTVVDKSGNMVNEWKLISPYSVFFDIKATIDTEDNVLISWCELASNTSNSQVKYTIDGFILKGNSSKIHYVKQAANGSILINDTVVASTSSYKLHNAAITVDASNNFYIFWDEQHNYTMPHRSCLKKFMPNGSLIYTQEIDPQWVTAAWTNNDYLCVVGTVGEYFYAKEGVYTKMIGNNGTIVLNALRFSDNFSLSPQISNHENITHVIWHHEELKIWQSGRHIEEFYYYTIYYTTFDSNGHVLIDKMVIDTDGKPPWETVDYTGSIINTLLWVAGIVCVITISCVSVKILLKRRKKKETNITHTPKEKYPPPPW